MYRSLKGYLVFAALAIIAAFLVYSHYMVREIEREVETISRVYGKFCSRITEDETSVIFDEIITKINFPVIVTTPDGEVISARNVKSTTPIAIAKLNKEHTPIKIEYQGKILAFVHYGDSKLRKLLKFAPFAQISLGGLLFIIGIIWLYTLRRSEENALFAGISKETAHQLGTPISALMGWKELMKDEEIKTYFHEDLERLKSIATRFHKVGSPPEFKFQPIIEVIKTTIEYLKNRIPKNVTIKLGNMDSSFVYMDNELFSWAIENLIKNSIDAKSTEITVSVKTEKIQKHSRGGFYDIIIRDNGIGVPSNLKKKIFFPGFTTKDYGWGMGLSLVQRIVKMHNGKIICKSNKNGGISFIIRLKNQHLGVNNLIFRNLHK